MLKTAVMLIIFVLIMTDSSKKKYLLEIEIFCKIINNFTVTFDQFNVSLVNKSIHFFKKCDHKTLVY